MGNPLLIMKDYITGSHISTAGFCKGWAAFQNCKHHARYSHLEVSNIWVGENAQWLRAHTVLSKNHRCSSQPNVTPAPGDQTPSSALRGYLQAQVHSPPPNTQFFFLSFTFLCNSDVWHHTPFRQEWSQQSPQSFHLRVRKSKHSTKLLLIQQPTWYRTLQLMFTKQETRQTDTDN